MKKIILLTLWVFTSLNAQTPLTNTFTYQGELKFNNALASGVYDFEFSVFDVETAGTVLETLVIEDVNVSNGVFTTPITLTNDLFTGNKIWLAIGVRDGASTGVFDLLSPRQEVTSSPYAIHAQFVGADAVTGVQIQNGSITATDIDTNSVQQRVSGSCATGQYLQSVNADGSVNCALDNDTIAPAAWELGGNAGTTAGTNFIGTTDNQALEVKTNGSTVAYFGVETNTGAPNIIFGSAQNIATAADGATIGGGGDPVTFSCLYENGSPNSPCINRANGRYSTIGGGRGNNATGTDSVVAGGFGNTASELFATVGGGQYNNASGFNTTVGGGNSNMSSGSSSTVGGGFFNRSSGSRSTVGGGENNEASGTSSTVSGGYNNIAVGLISTVGGGELNIASGYSATVGGGTGNTASNTQATVGGGFFNNASGFNTTVGGGENNMSSGSSSTVGGGFFNRSSGSRSTVGGGENNEASGTSSTVSGGYNNIAFGFNTTVGGGELNIASGYSATVGGGVGNTASNEFATIPGGIFNQAGGQYSFAAGRRAKVRDASQVGGTDTNGDEGTFIWADSTDAEYTSTGPNQFLIRATGGVGIGTNAPQNQLQVEQSITGDTIDKHVVQIINSSAGSTTAVLALKVGKTTSPTITQNFVSFYDGNNNRIGQIDGNGAGGILYDTSGADFAEYLPAVDNSLKKAEVVGLKSGKLSRNTDNAERIFVVSSTPAFVGNKLQDNSSPKALVAFTGQVPVNVKGKVSIGDWVLASGNNDGKAIAVPSNQLASTNLSLLIGRAINNSHNNQVKVLVGLPQQALIAMQGQTIKQQQAQIEQLQQQQSIILAQLKDTKALGQELAQLKSLLLKSSQQKLLAQAKLRELR